MLDHVSDGSNLRRVSEGCKIDRFQITPAVEITRLVEHIGDTARHPGSKVPAGLPEHHDAATCHVLAAMVPDGFDDGAHTAIADAETLASHATDIGFPTGCPIKRYVANNDVFFWHIGGTGRRIEDDPPAR